MKRSNNSDPGNQAPVVPSVPKPEAGLVYLDDNFNDLRFESIWNSQDLMASVHPLLDTARAEGSHIWHSSEQHQVYAVACWNAASRRSMAEALLAGVEHNVYYKGSYPAAIADLSKSFFLDAEKWYAFASEVSADPDYRMSNETLTSTANWPMPPGAQTSPLFMSGLQRILGLGGEESSWLNDLMPHIDQEVDGPNRLGFFEPYKEKMDREQAALQRKLAFLKQRWQAGLDPNTEPGLSLYKEMVQCTEALLAHGAHKLMPFTSDPDMRLAEKPKKAPKQPESKLPSFDPFNLPLAVGAVSLGEFNLDDLQNSDETAQPEPPAEVVQSSLPSFDFSQLQGDTPKDESPQVPSSSLPAFNLTQLEQPAQPATETSEADDEPTSSLPAFDLGKLLGEQE